MFGLRRFGRENIGTAVVESALVLPMLLIMAGAVWDFGRLLDTQVIATNAAREGARFAALNTTDPNLAADVQTRVMIYLQEGFGSRLGSVGGGGTCTGGDVCLQASSITVAFLDASNNSVAAAPGQRVKITVPVTTDVIATIVPGLANPTMTLTTSASMQLE